MKPDKRILKIPLDKIGEGIDLCLKNASEFCSDADILIEQKSYEHALGLCILATEELGKAIMLKEQSAYARKRSEKIVTFKRVKPENYFKATKREDLRKLGFTDGKINPFYDHLSKLLYARNIKALATHERIMLSLEEERFQTIDEIFEKVRRLKMETQEVSIDLREEVFYVNYYQKEGKWRRGVKIDSGKAKELISDIRKSINLLAS